MKLSLLFLLLTQVNQIDMDSAPPAAKAFAAQHFKFDTDKGFVVLPLTIDGKDYPFILGTRANITTYDTQLRSKLGEPFKDDQISIVGFPSGYDLHHKSRVYLGTSVLRQSEIVGCTNIRDVFTRAGADIYGMISVDSLRANVVQVDFDRGIVTVANDVPPNPGVMAPLYWTDDGYPQVNVDLLNGVERLFIIDTANVNTLELHDTLFDGLSRDKIICERQWNDIRANPSHAGKYGEAGYLAESSLAGYALRKLSVKRRNMDILGLGYLSQFKVIFDFPRDRMYLRPSSRFGKSLDDELKGFIACWRNDQLIITALEKNGPAAAVGLRLKDEIRRVNDLDVSDNKLFEKILVLFNSPGQKLILQIQREGKQYEFQLVVPLKRNWGEENKGQEKGAGKAATKAGRT